MSASVTVWRTGDPPLPDLSDYARVRAMSDEELERIALEDPDSLLDMTEEERRARLAELDARTPKRRQAAE